MVTYQQLDSGDCSFTARPNCALGWVWMKRLCLGLTVCIGAVAAWFVSKGAWLVLPFAGLEVAVLSIGVYLNARWSANREIILLKGADLRIFRGSRRLVEVGRLPRYWSRVTVLRDPRGWYLSRILLECHGRRCEVGTSLVESERIRLGEELRARLSFQCSMRQAEVEPVLEGLGAAEQKI